MIDSFKDKYGFLSNFYMSPVTYEGQIYPSVEHGFQAAKTLDASERKKIASLKTPGESKKAGRALNLRRDWDNVRIKVMENLLRDKFSPQSNPSLAALLIATGSEELVEGNWWGDRFWGVCKGTGANNLGKLLMIIRKDISAQSSLS